MTNYNGKDLFNALMWAINEELPVSKEHMPNLNSNSIGYGPDDGWVLEGLNHIRVIASFMTNMDLTAEERMAVDGIVAVVEKRKEIIEEHIKMMEHYDNLKKLLANELT